MDIYPKVGKVLKRQTWKLWKVISHGITQLALSKRQWPEDPELFFDTTEIYRPGSGTDPKPRPPISFTEKQNLCFGSKYYKKIHQSIQRANLYYYFVSLFTLFLNVLKVFISLNNQFIHHAHCTDLLLTLGLSRAIFPFFLRSINHLSFTRLISVCCVNLFVILVKKLALKYL